MRIGMEQAFRGTRQALASLPDGATPKQRIDAAIEGHLRGIFSHPNYTSANIKFHGQISSEILVVIEPLRDEYNALWRSLLEGAREDGWLKEELHISFLRPLIIGGLNRTLTWFDPSRGSFEDLVETSRQLFDGLWKPDRLATEVNHPRQRKAKSPAQHRG